jgi:hypothetical protein
MTTLSALALYFGVCLVLLLEVLRELVPWLRSRRGRPVARALSAAAGLLVLAALVATAARLKAGG